MQNETRLLDHVHHYAEKYNWAIIPVRGKEAVSKWRRYIRAFPSRRQRGGLFSVAGVTGLAVIPGEVSAGLRVRDFDVADAYDRWAATYPDLAASLPTARTSRGYHVYFRADMPDGVTAYTDGELRAGKCVVVLPPSPHPDGGRYEWLLPPGDEVPFLDDVAGSGLVGPAPELPNAPEAVPEEVADAIAKTLPTQNGQRHNLLFKFARRLKGIPGLDTSAASLSGYVAEWHRQALPHIKTKHYLATAISFQQAWQNARVPLTDEVFWGIVSAAKKRPEPAWFRDWFFPDSGKLLLRVCIGLAEHAGDEPFFLSARLAGDSIGVAHKDALELLRCLVTEGRLRLVEKGDYKSGLASTWRYLPPKE